MDNEVRLRLYDESGTLFASIVGIGEGFNRATGAVLRIKDRRYQVIGPPTEEIVDGNKMQVIDAKLRAWQ